MIIIIYTVWKRKNVYSDYVATTPNISPHCVYAVMYPLCFLSSFTTPESRGPVSRCGRQGDWGSQVEDAEMRRDVHRDMLR